MKKPSNLIKQIKDAKKEYNRLTREHQSSIRLEGFGNSQPIQQIKSK